MALILLHVPSFRDVIVPRVDVCEVAIGQVARRFAEIVETAMLIRLGIVTLLFRRRWR